MSSVHVRHTSPGRAKQARLSTWPSVSSFEHAVAEPDDRARRPDTRAASARSAPRERSGLRLRLSSALLRHERGALPVHVNGAAFVHEVRDVAIAALDLEHLAPRPARSWSHGDVETALEAAPRVEDASRRRARRRGRSRRTWDRRRASSVVARQLDDTDGVREELPRASTKCAIRNADGDRLELRDGARNRGERLLRGTRTARASCPAARARASSSPHAARTRRASGSRLAWRGRESPRHPDSLGERLTPDACRLTSKSMTPLPVADSWSSGVRRRTSGHHAVLGFRPRRSLPP